MLSLKSLGLYQALLSILFCTICVCDEVCDRRPLGTKTDPLPPDNQFTLEIDGIRDNKYIPQNQYTVRLSSKDPKSTFIAFTISLRQDSIVNKANPRKRTLLKTGILRLSSNSTNTKYKIQCNNTIVESDITAKTSVEALWIAPEKDNACVTIFAVVAVKPDVWYSFEGPLSKRVCEDRRKSDDMQPMENDNCNVCEDARYQLTFEGTWSHNTHQSMFPPTRELARFSDVVGASHNKNFILYKYNSEASQGLKMLAEQGNTTQLELEIQETLGTDVRTIIKATGPPQTNMTTLVNFRVTREYHFVSLVTAILPSPDWFLGVAYFELCSADTGNWVNTVTLNLYPLDAGTDKGKGFESANEETSPHQPISLADIAKDIPREQIKPFARLHFNLVRTYSTPTCATEAPVTERKEEEEVNIKKEQPNVTPTPITTTSEEPPSVDPNSTEECPMSTWEEWLPCEGECIDGKIMGLKIRFRYHMIDGVVVGKYGESSPENAKTVPRYCLNKYPDSMTESCEEPCEIEQEEYEEEPIEASAQRGSWDTIKPGRKWGTRK